MATLASTIITDFELYLDDMTELSSTEEIALLNRVQNNVCNLKAWEFLKTAGTGTTSTSVDYVALPSNFAYLVQNANYTDSSYAADRPVVFVGSTYEPYQVISWSDRRQYRNKSNYAYIDIGNSRLVFTLQPTSSQAVEFDYIKTPTVLTTSDNIAIPDRFAPVLFHGMCVDDFIIQMSDKAKSYKSEHEQKYKMYLDDMAYWNAKLIQI